MLLSTTFYIFSCLSLAAGGLDFELTRADGRPWRLSDHDGPTVVVFLGTQCPLANLYAGRLGELEHRFRVDRVRFVGVNPTAQDSLEEIARFVRRHELQFPFLKDNGAKVATRLGAVRTPEVFLLDDQRRIHYQGRIDDQWTPGTNRSEPTRRDLELAIEALLAGEPVRVPRTEAVGCLIDRPVESEQVERITYSRHVAPILNRRCVSCHRPGQSAPFSLMTYEDTIGWGAMIREVIQQRRMPPWGADPAYGQFANDPSLTEDEKETVFTWIDSGAVEGDPNDLPAPPTLVDDDWRIGQPDLVLSMPEEFRVPAQGVLDYQHFVLDPGLSEDTWVRAVQIKPGNRAVVHHATVYFTPPGSTAAHTPGVIKNFYLAMYVPGQEAYQLPAGFAKRVPAGWRLILEVHYTPVGWQQSDRTSVGLVFCDAADVRKEVSTRIAFNLDFEIQPHLANQIFTASQLIERDMQLLALFPHMHLRGKSMRFEAIYPGGQRETLLNVPRYDFAWQQRYELTNPQRLPAGTQLLCTATFDNSSGNPNNPDPGATVRYGNLTTDEMLQGHFELCLADDVSAAAFYQQSWWQVPSWLGPLALLGLIGLTCYSRWQAAASRRSDNFGLAV